MAQEEVPFEIAPSRSLYHGGRTFKKGDEAEWLDALAQDSTYSSEDIRGMLSRFERTGTIILHQPLAGEAERDLSPPQDEEDESNDDEPKGDDSDGDDSDDSEDDEDDEDDPAPPPEDDDGVPAPDGVLVNEEGLLTDNFTRADVLREQGIETIGDLLDYPEDFTSLDRVGETYAERINKDIRDANF